MFAVSEGGKYIYVYLAVVFLVSFLFFWILWLFYRGKLTLYKI